MTEAMLALLLLGTGRLSAGTLDALARDAFAFWDGGFRDNTTGAYCDQTNFGTIADGSQPCHPGMGKYWFSSAGTGMGLVIDAAATELGLHTKAEGAKRALQTLTTVSSKWPKEPTYNFLAHFVSPPW
eukprot:gene8939-31512_t